MLMLFVLLLLFKQQKYLYIHVAKASNIVMILLQTQDSYQNVIRIAEQITWTYMYM